ncbi:uncharacterized protein LOC118203864 [Stegodyphus dumicola]|uniref:uncharacterized protein LOC118203864 n=1 Tax=Stegodyphus dumicola TaxID=202533 RepID=UPI0015B137AF|nr:uncharacterized protein LOC118203864 [Stegodyphus dumicola]
MDLKKRTQAIAKYLRHMQGYRWGLNPHIHKILYQTVTEKMVTYGAAVWAQPLQGRKFWHLLSIQRQFALNITRAFRTTATNSLNDLAGLVPLHISTEREAVLQQIKQLNVPASFEDTTYWPSDYEVPAVILDKHPAEQWIGINVSIKEQSLETHRHNTYAYTDGSKMDRQPEDIQMFDTLIFTDGSKMDHNVGCAFVTFQGQEQVTQWKGHLHGNNSVFQGEAVAIQKVVQYIVSNNIKKAVIVSDSMSALRALQNLAHSSSIVQEIQSLLRQFKHLEARLTWTKVHAGNMGNEAADLLAKDAALNKEAEELALPWPHSTLKRMLHLQLSKWQAEWDIAETGRRIHYHLLYVNPAMLYSNPHLVRYVTGHGPFPKYFARHGTTDTDQCSCGHLGTPEHYVTTCSLTNGMQYVFPLQTHGHSVSSWSNRSTSAGSSSKLWRS